MIDDDIEDQTFTIISSWKIPNFPQQAGTIKSETYENSVCKFFFRLDIDKQDPLHMTIEMTGQKTTIPIQFTIVINNLSNDTKSEKVDEFFNFSPNATSTDVEFKRAARWYKKSSGFLTEDDAMIIDFTVKTKNTDEFEALPSCDTGCIQNPYGSSTYYNSYNNINNNSNYSYFNSGYNYGGFYQNTDNSKEETGYVGLKNQGATCYMNSFLQSLYHLPAFRRLVYSLHTTGTENPDTSIPLNLQRLFCRMQLSTKSCSTKLLTKSFGWGDAETFTQHDVHEFCRVLLDNIERKLKGTELENSIADLFRGKFRSFIRCKNIQCESSRIEDYYDLQMVVKGCSSLQQSFEIYTEKELLDGENQYQTDNYGKQDAEMGLEFIEYPKILHIHLRRFDYDFDYNQQVKINDLFEFPNNIDLKEYLAEDKKNSPSMFELFGVLVHMGSVYAGHYYAFLRTTEDPQWYEFNDTKVSKVDLETAVNDNFGGQTSTGYFHEKSYSAYILIYVRKDATRQVFDEIQEGTIPKHLVDFFEHEKIAEEERLKLQEEQKNQIKLNILTDECIIRKTSENTKGFDEPKTTQTLYLEKTMTVADAIEKVKKLLNFEKIRLWHCNTYSTPSEIFKLSDSEKRIDSFHYSSVTVFAQNIDEELPPNSIVVWIKFFFPGKEAPLQYVGAFTVDRNSPISTVYPAVNKKIGFPEDTGLLSYLETFNTPKVLNDTESFNDAQISNGNIVILQQTLHTPLLTPTITFVPEAPKEQDAEKEKEEKENKIDYGDVKVFYTNDISDPLSLAFTKYNGSKSPQIELLIFEFENPSVPLFYLRFPSITQPCDLKRIISEKMGHEYNSENDSIELFKEDEKNPGNPGLTPISLNNQLSTWIFGVKEGVASKIYVFYHKGISESELDKTFLLSFQLQDNGYIADQSFRYRMTKNCTVSEVIASLIESGKLEANKKYKLCEQWQNKIYKIFDENEILTYISSVHLIQKIPEDQLNLEEGSKIINGVFCFVSEYGNPECFGTPFLIKISPKESFADFKTRLIANLKLDEESLEKVKFMIGETYPKVSELREMKEGDVVSDVVAEFNKEIRLYLLYEHDKKGKHASSTSMYTQKEKAITINN